MQKHWLLIQKVIVFVLSVLLGALSTFSGGFIPVLLVDGFSYRTYIQNFIIAGIIFLVYLLIVLITIIRKGFTSQLFNTLIVTFTVAIVGIVALLVLGMGGEGEIASISGDLAILIALAIILVIVFISILICTIAAAISGFNATIVAGILVGTSIMTRLLYAENSDIVRHHKDVSSVILFAVMSLCAITALSFYIAWRALEKDEKFALARTFGVIFGAIGGTSFRGSNLAYANFNNAILKGSNFSSTKQQQTLLTQVFWKDANQLDKARRGNSMLSDLAVCELLVTRNGCKKSYINTDLRGANLNRVNLNEANLTRAILSEATLVYAELQNTNLTETLAIGTDFTRSLLTGACLEAWNIDDTTNLDDVDCQYVFLKNNQQERRPSSGDFASREFTKLFQEVLSTVDLIFRNGIDWKAFEAALRQVQIKKEDTPLEIQSIENKGDGMVVVRVKVPPDANKEEIHREFNQQYELALKALEDKYRAELQAKDGEIAIYRKQSANMLEVIKLQATNKQPVNVPIHVQAIAKAMNDSTDQSQNVTIGGNVTGSTINLGEISGSVSNAVNQLPNSPDPKQPGIKELLAELQAAIEGDADLPEKGKATALEQVKVLAEVGQDSEQPEKKDLGSRAINLLKGAASFLPDTAKLAEACSKLLPLIAKALGLPV